MKHHDRFPPQGAAAAFRSGTQRESSGWPLLRPYDDNLVKCTEIIAIKGQQVRHLMSEHDRR